MHLHTTPLEDKIVAAASKFDPDPSTTCPDCEYKFWPEIDAPDIDALIDIITRLDNLVTALEAARDLLDREIDELKDQLAEGGSL